MPGFIKSENSSSTRYRAGLASRNRWSPNGFRAPAYHQISAPSHSRWKPGWPFIIRDQTVTEGMLAGLALAPAKINLGLEITGKRSDGYHDLSTIMQTVSIFDRIR